MEPFTLIIWLWIGQRFEETQIVNMGRGECVERKVMIESDRHLAKGQCIGAGGYILPMDRPHRPCAHLRCGLPARAWHEARERAEAKLKEEAEGKQ